jgi:2,3-bisphosphoglycerate-dependent phosphoglycerate mutase
MGLRLFLIRHAQTVWNRDRRYQGWQDSPLSEVGRAQAEAVGRALAREPLKAVYSSTLGRARETAEAIAALHGLAVQPDPDFREMAFGEWEGLCFEDCKAKDPDRYRLWADEPHRFCPPGGGETLDDVRRRVLAGLERLRAEHDDQSVCLVAHGISARIIILEALGLPLERIWSIHLASTGISELEFRPDWTALHRMNTLVHLDAVPVAR